MSALFSSRPRRPASAPRSGRRPGPTKKRSDARVRALADGYLEGFFERNPDQVTRFGVTGRHHDALPDNSLDALNAWQAKEDGWLGRAT